MTARTNKKGRSKGTGRFLQLHHWMMGSAAWRSLKPQDRAVYIEIAMIYDGQNNGRIALGVRDAAERANVNKDTAAACFRRLEERGFIECAQAGGFSYKVRHATEWRLTHLRCDKTGQMPSKAFMKWRENAEPSPPISDSRSPVFGQSVADIGATVPSFRTKEPA